MLLLGTTCPKWPSFVLHWNSTREFPLGLVPNYDRNSNRHLSLDLFKRVSECQFIVNGELTVHKNDCVDGQAVYGGTEPLIHYDSVLWRDKNVLIGNRLDRNISSLSFWQINMLNSFVNSNNMPSKSCVDVTTAIRYSLVINNASYVFALYAYD